MNLAVYLARLALEDCLEWVQVKHILDLAERETRGELILHYRDLELGIEPTFEQFLIGHYRDLYLGLEPKRGEPIGGG